LEEVGTLNLKKISKKKNKKKTWLLGDNGEIRVGTDQ
jgi:hypothetical protein